MEELARVDRPVAKDQQLYELLKNRLNLSKAATVEFIAAKRDDLMEKEQAQIAVLEEYIGALELATDDEILRLANEANAEIRSQGRNPRMGHIIKRILTKLNGKPAEMTNVARIVRDSIDLQTTPRGNTKQEAS